VPFHFILVILINIGTLDRQASRPEIWPYTIKALSFGLAEDLV
jgi:hypothetical protein